MHKRERVYDMEWRISRGPGCKKCVLIWGEGPGGGGVTQYPKIFNTFFVTLAH